MLNSMIPRCMNEMLRTLKMSMSPRILKNGLLASIESSLSRSSPEKKVQEFMDHQLVMLKKEGHHYVHDAETRNLLDVVMETHTCGCCNMTFCNPYQHALHVKTEICK